MNPPIPEDQSNEDSKYRMLRKKKRERLQRQRGSVLIWEKLEDEIDAFLDNYKPKPPSVPETAEPPSVPETAEPPSDLVLPLLRYQKEWLAWSLKQEESTVKGGILADEMGMGKTIQAIALVLAQRELKKATSGSSILSSSTGTSQELPTVKGTLVVCPGNGAMQWFHEIERCTTKGSNKTLLYHGPNREKCMYKLEEYDFVITTYSTLQADCRPRKSKQNRKNSIWTEDVSRRKSVLHSVKWERIILDEAHYIKDVSCKTTKAVLALESSYKWALTGVPLQNKTDELYSVVRFLQVKPYAYYFCEDCNCCELDLSFSDKCPQCPGEPHNHSHHFLWWGKYINRSVDSVREKSVCTDAVDFLNHKILKSLLLRRTKMERVADLSLPPKTVIMRKDSLDVSEYDDYKSLQSRIRAQFNRYIRAGTVMNNYGDVSAMITRLRQAANHRYLVIYSSGNKEARDIEQSCDLCHDAVEDPIVTPCRHVFCKACLIELAESVEKMPCPLCTKLLTFDFTANNDKGDSNSKPTVKGFRSSSILNKIQLDKFKTSTKIEALREEISFMYERDGSAKGIVFSQFTSFLDLIQYSLNLLGINCVQLVGSMSIATRDSAINRFTEDPDCRILLMSFKVGAVALNLTVASHVFLMDPWWNPAVEQQAQDRIHRIGQHKPVWIVRFVIKDTIEEDIIELQERKKLLFERTVGGSSEAFGKLTEKELRSLFNRDL